MQITDRTVVSLQYVLRNAAGEILDQSQTGTPFEYLHGAGNLVPGVEEALAGKAAGDSLEVEVPPEKGYGERDERMVTEVPREQLPDGKVELGTQFRVEHEGGFGVVTVTRMDGDTILLDGNHPLAGETLHFQVSVETVRPATEEELQHGHAHGAGGHQH